MSKEQTPITAEEQHYLNEIREGRIVTIEEANRHANAKVLEALERHIVGFVIHSANEDLSEDDKGYNEFVNLVKNYIETEVKPKDI